MKNLLLLPIIALSACTTIKPGPLPPPPEKLVCKELPEKPDLKPLEAIKMPDGVVYYRKADVDDRDAPIAQYIVILRGVAFDCRSQLQWNATYWEGQG